LILAKFNKAAILKNIYLNQQYIHVEHWLLEGLLW